MFKTIRYMLLASLYKKTKRSFKILFFYLLVLALGNLIFTDLININNGANIYILLVIKWVFVVVLMALISFRILKIVNVALDPFKKVNDELNDKKNRIISKEKLFTKSDLIIQKYTENLS